MILFFLIYNVCLYLHSSPAFKDSVLIPKVFTSAETLFIQLYHNVARLLGFGATREVDCEDAIFESEEGELLER